MPRKASIPPILLTAGMKIGRWTLIRSALSPHGHRLHLLLVKWHCRCDCGRTNLICEHALRTGRTHSCGCLILDVSRAKAEVFFRPSSLREIWKGMIKRCSDPAAVGYKNYGGRGIYVCDVWLKSYDAFYDYMGPRPSKKHSVDRIDNDGPYAPENCRWATAKQQTNNTRRTILVVYNGIRMSLTEALEASGAHVTRDIARARLKAGRSLEASLGLPND